MLTLTAPHLSLEKATIMNTQQPKNSQHLGITLPITTEFKLIAERFSQLCPFSEKAQQIKHNTLAVCAVNAYLQLMDIPTDITAGDSWKPEMQMMANAADLSVLDVGILSCRPLLPEASTCHIPPEDWQNRAGYIAVIIDEAMDQATLVGFTPTVDHQEEISLSRFSPIETLIDYVHLEATTSTGQATSEQRSSTTQQARTALTQLGAWINGTIASSWQAADALINPADLSFAFRNATGVAETTRNVATDISRAKLVDLGLQLGQSVRVALVVNITQSAIGQTDIILQVRPLGDSPYLDEGLQLNVFDDQNVSLMTATSRAIDNYIQIQLSGTSGEQFRVDVSLKDAVFTERFVI
ncbi:MAG: DUF1822 family protein [Cyanobacteria bacterium J06635_11]